MAKKIVTSWDDGAAEDLKMARLLLEYDLPAIFYVPNRCHLKEEMIYLLAKLDFEIGGHTVNHPEDLKRLPSSIQFWEISENKKWLEKILKKPVRTFAYPGGKFNEETIFAVKAAGFSEARGVGWQGREYPVDPFRVMPSAFVHPDRSKFGDKSWFEWAREMWEGPGDYFHLFGHSAEVERHHLWEELENFFKILKK